MTWRELIDWLEKQIADGNLQPEDAVWSIDVTFPEANDLRLWKDNVGTALYD